MKKVYFAGKFKKLQNKGISLEESLKDDYRAKILGGSQYLVNYSPNLKINNRIIYAGPFYCEKASNGDYTSTDCTTVVNAEFMSVSESDVCVFVFNQSFSAGTIVELGWAIEQNKEIIIFYKQEASEYQIKSEYWFAISDALQRGRNVKVFDFMEDEEAISEILKIVKEL